jgi:hypothetical protein
MQTPRTFTTPDGAEYTRVPASELPSGDDIDSTEVVDDGAPQDEL